MTPLLFHEPGADGAGALVVLPAVSRPAAAFRPLQLHPANADAPDARPSCRNFRRFIAAVQY